MNRLEYIGVLSHSGNSTMAGLDEENFVSFDDQWLEALSDEERTNIQFRRAFYTLYKDMSWKRDISIAFFVIALLSVIAIILRTLWSFFSFRWTSTLFYPPLKCPLFLFVARSTSPPPTSNHPTSYVKARVSLEKAIYVLNPIYKIRFGYRRDCYSWRFNSSPTQPWMNEWKDPNLALIPREPFVDIWNFHFFYLNYVGKKKTTKGQWKQKSKAENWPVELQANGLFCPSNQTLRPSQRFELSLACSSLPFTFTF